MTDYSRSRLVDALQEPCRYDFPVERVELVETHISWILLTGSYAFKIKKPVDLGFVDFSTIDKRLVACRDELRLNQRFAPQLYREVVPITGTPDDPKLAGDGPAIEYAVKIVQFPAAARLDHVLSRHELLSAHIDALAAEVAAFHSRAAVAEPGSRYRRATRFYEPIEQTLTSLREDLLAPALSAATAAHELNQARRQCDQLAVWMRREFDGRTATFAARAEQGCVRECHGDLHLANMVVLEGKITLFDCLEFSAELRWIDVLSDVAFATMDLASRGRNDFAGRLLNAYLEMSGEYAGLPVFRFYYVYRALVRAKVALLRRQQQEVASDHDRAALWRECRGYLDLAEHTTHPAAPRLLLTHGLSGSGKTTGTQALLEASDAVRIRSDVERKRLFTGGTISGDLYLPTATRATYERLAELSRAVIDAGFMAVVDATFLRRADRDQFRRLARELQVPWAILHFDASPAVLRQRIAQRLDTGRDASDATAEVLEEQLRDQEPLGDDELTATVRIDSNRAPTVEVLLAAVAEKARVPGR